MSKILSVFGATGNQGGSVIDAVLADPALSSEYKVRGITRDASKPKAKTLAERGVEVVEADMSSVEAAAVAVKGAHTVFLVTNFWEHLSAETELAQGKAVVDASKAAGVQRIVFSSLINVTEASSGRLSHVSHFDGKAKIEQYVRESGIPAVFFLPGLFMTGMFDMIKKGEDGVLTYALPADGEKAQVPLFDVVADTGKFVKVALKNFDAYAGKRIHAATDYYSPSRIVAEFKEASGKEARFVQVPVDVFKGFLPPPVAQELTENMLLLEDPGYYAGAKLSHEDLEEKPTAWKDFVKANKDKW